MVTSDNSCASVRGKQNDPNGVPFIAEGLSTEEAQRRLVRFGPNNILSEAGHGLSRVFVDTAKDPMIWLLLSTSALFAWTGDRLEAVILASATLPIVGMDAFLHRRTSVSTAALAGQLSTVCAVLRDGVLQQRNALELVPGDVMVVKTNDSFSADGVIISGQDIQIDESALTGEAMPVRKHVTLLHHVHSGVAPDGAARVSAGTRLLTGEARVFVSATGKDTFYGQVVRAARLERQQPTQLQSAVRRIVMRFTVAAVGVCGLLATTRYMQGYGLLDAFVSAATLAVAALPEEFPVVLTLFLGLGVYRLSRHKALVKRAVAVEDIGRVTCICSDKTGTITFGKLSIDTVVPFAKMDVEAVLGIAAAASRMDSGDPMDKAILARSGQQMGWKSVNTFPFTEDRRRESTVLKINTARFRVVTKGAPETIVALCKLSTQLAAQFHKQVQEYSSQGKKVIACAWKEQTSIPQLEPQTGFTLAGLIVFADPVRADVPAAIARARKEGIRVILVTGDHAATAASVAAQLGFEVDASRLIEGNEVSSRLNPERINSFDIVARATPLQKRDLVAALKHLGHIVAVTGDGVNDVPALQAANIGIAMGERGTRPAREAATIVLLDDSFATIIKAIDEGRNLFWNLRLSFAYLFCVHLPLTLAAAAIPFTGYPLLFLPIHVVWLELIIHPTAILAFQSSDVAQERDRPRPLKNIFDTGDWLVLIAVGCIASFLVCATYVYALGPNMDSTHARAASLATLIATSSAFSLGLAGLHNRLAAISSLAATVSVLVLTQVPALSSIMSLSPIHWDDWLIASGSAVISFILATAFKGRSSSAS